MEKDGRTPDVPPEPHRPSLAEEQRRAFDEDRRRLARQSVMRWPGFLFRN